MTLAFEPKKLTYQWKLNLLRLGKAKVLIIIVLLQTYLIVLGMRQLTGQQLRTKEGSNADFSSRG